jgi:hypothetical protein
MPDAAYYRAWRASHPDYRKREAVRLRARKQAMTPEQRRADRGRRKPVPPLEPIPVLWAAGQHPLIDLAWGYVSHCPNGTVLSFREDELILDAIGVAVLAMLERRDPKAAVAAFFAVENNWLVKAAPFLMDGDVNDNDDP